MLIEGVNLRQLPVSQLDQLRILLRSDLDKLNDVSGHISVRVWVIIVLPYIEYQFTTCYIVYQVYGITTICLVPTLSTLCVLSTVL